MVDVFNARLLCIYTIVCVILTNLLKHIVINNLNAWIVKQNANHVKTILPVNHVLMAICSMVFAHKINQAALIVIKIKFVSHVVTHSAKIAINLIFV